MKRIPTIKKTWLMAGVAAIVVLGGAGLFAMIRSPAEAPAAASEAGHSEEEGDHAGDEEGVIVVTAAQIAAADIAIVAVTGGGGGETRLSGRVEPMTDARAAVAASVAGRVERVLVAPGQSVRAGQPLVVLVSGDAASLRADADAAEANAIAAEQAHSREESLADQGVVARRDAEIAHAEALSAQAAARAARARATAAGSPSASGRLNVAQGGVIAEVTNPARVEIVFSAPPALAGQVRVGSAMRVQGPAGEFDAVVAGVAAGAGVESGAAIIRARPTGSLLPPAGSAVTGVIVTGETSGTLTVPFEAVQTVEGRTVVFVRTATGFRVVPVLVGRRAGDRTEILRGLTGDERVAGTNAFLLKAELAKGEAEHGH